jgi:hypothetical protein
MGQISTKYLAPAVFFKLYFDETIPRRGAKVRRMSKVKKNEAK